VSARSPDALPFDQTRYDKLKADKRQPEAGACRAEVLKC
jgi:hypothetical protein